MFSSLGDRGFYYISHPNNPAKITNFSANPVRSLTKDSFFVKTACAFAETGQIQSQAIKAAGKAMLSPLMIMNNPLIKEDLDSRKYSAAMQPIEAGFAFITSTFVNLAAGRFINKMAASGRLGDMYKFAGKTGNALIKAQKSLKIFKARAFVAITLVTIPVTSTILNKTYPKILKFIFGNKNREKLQKFWEMPYATSIANSKKR